MVGGMMTPLTVADTDDGRTFVVPYQQPDVSKTATVGTACLCAVCVDDAIKTWN